MRETGGERPLFLIFKVLPGFQEFFRLSENASMGTETGGPASSQKYHRNQCPKGEDEHCNLA
jgi:hypothetical protein